MSLESAINTMNAFDLGAYKGSPDYVEGVVSGEITDYSLVILLAVRELNKHEHTAEPKPDPLCPLSIQHELEKNLHRTRLALKVAEDNLAAWKGAQDYHQIAQLREKNHERAELADKKVERLNAAFDFVSKVSAPDERTKALVESIQKKLKAEVSRIRNSEKLLDEYMKTPSSYGRLLLARAENAKEAHRKIEDETKTLEDWVKELREMMGGV
jgi:hypothetical protein